MRKSGILILFAFLPISLSALSQPAFEAPAEVITLGNSATTLGGTWKFAPGDSPLVNGSRVWAQPGFNDNAWATIDLSPKSGSIDQAYGTLGFVPGWTAQGFPKLDGYAWYRLRLRVADSGQQLWLKMPNDVDDAYQIYVNGRYIGQFGDFSPRGVKVYSARSISFPVPPPGPDGTMEIALRFFMTDSTRFQSHDAGGMHQPPALGLASTVHMLQAADDDANLHFYLGTVLESLFFLLAVPLALWAWLNNRQERIYLWLCLVLTIVPARMALLLLGNLISVISLGTNGIFLDVISSPLLLPLWIMFWWDWFGLRNKRWIPHTAWSLAAVEMLALLCVRLPATGFDLVPRSWLPLCNSASTWCLAALGVLLAAIVIEGFRRDRTEALAAALPILLFEFSSFNAYFLQKFGISTQFYPFGIGISTGAIASFSWWWSSASWCCDDCCAAR